MRRLIPALFALASLAAANPSSAAPFVGRKVERVESLRVWEDKTVTDAEVEAVKREFRPKTTDQPSAEESRPLTIAPVRVIMAPEPTKPAMRKPVPHAPPKTTDPLVARLNRLSGPDVVAVATRPDGTLVLPEGYAPRHSAALGLRKDRAPHVSRLPDVLLDPKKMVVVEDSPHSAELTQALQDRHPEALVAQAKERPGVERRLQDLKSFDAKTKPIVEVIVPEADLGVDDWKIVQNLEPELTEAGAIVTESRDATSLATIGRPRSDAIIVVGHDNDALGRVVQDLSARRVFEDKVVFLVTCNSPRVLIDRIIEQGATSVVAFDGLIHANRVEPALLDLAKELPAPAERSPREAGHSKQDAGALWKIRDILKRHGLRGIPHVLTRMRAHGRLA